MTKNYFNIPVDDEETYIAVKEIAKSNGFGSRGMGQQIKAWVSQTLAAPVCDHPKTPVEVQWMPTDTALGEANLLHKGWFCQTCNRVYRESSAVKRQTMAPVSAEALAAADMDPYGQPAPVVVTRRKRSQRLGRDN